MTHRAFAAAPDGPPCRAAAPAHDAENGPRLHRIDRLADHGRLLLLQGPNGPFFRQLARRLRAQGAEVTKVNFNAGDDLFYARDDAICFEGPAPSWPAFLETVLSERGIAAIVLFGQDRPMHRAAVELAERLGVAVVVFEEGYVRPCWITMECDGVNGRSRLMAPLEASPTAAPAHRPEPRTFAFAFAAMAVYSIAYLLWGRLFRARYPAYEHHKPLALREIWPWLRCYARKWAYGLLQRRCLSMLGQPLGPSFFLVPLQMAVDSQITHHSPWSSNEGFITAVLESFAAQASPADLLVFKHHPLEIGHAHYGRAIARQAARLGIRGRVRYVHGGHLPSLLGRAKGVVLVNSTVGIQAMHHGTPVCATGAAIYAKPGLTHQADLDSFWCDPRCPDPALFHRFLDRVLDTQVNASFYAPGALSRWASLPPVHRPCGDTVASAVQASRQPVVRLAGADLGGGPRSAPFLASSMLRARQAVSARPAVPALSNLSVPKGISTSAALSGLSAPRAARAAPVHSFSESLICSMREPFEIPASGGAAMSRTVTRSHR